MLLIVLNTEEPSQSIRQANEFVIKHKLESSVYKGHMESGLREHTQLEIYVSLSSHVVAEYDSSVHFFQWIY